MTKSVTFTDPDPRFTEFIEKSNALDGAKLAAAIPKEYVQPSLARGILGLAASLSVYVGAIVAMAVLAMLTSSVCGLRSASARRRPSCSTRRPTRIRARSSSIVVSPTT